MISVSYMKECQETDTFIQLIGASYYLERKLSTVEIDNGVFLPWKRPAPNGPLHGIGGVLDSHGNYVNESASIAFGETRDRFKGSYEYDEKQVLFINETVIYLGLFHKQWGHFLMDFVPRLWFFLSDSSNYRIVYTTDTDELSGNYLKFIELLGINKARLLCIHKPTKFRNVVIPEVSYISGGFYSNEFLSIFKTIKEKVMNAPNETSVPEKIYLSRKHIRVKKEIGEEGIEDAFIRNGYSPIYMEELTLEKQIQYMSRAKSIVAISGTLCHNTLFCSDSTELIILNKTKKINGHQIIINQAMDLSVTYVDVYIEPFKGFPVSYGAGPFLVTKRSPELKRFFKERHFLYKQESIIRLCINFIKYCYKCCTIKIYKMISTSHLYNALYPLKSDLVKIYLKR